MSTWDSIKRPFTWTAEMCCSLLDSVLSVLHKTAGNGSGWLKQSRIRGYFYNSTRARKKKR